MSDRLTVLFALPGLHRLSRGAELAFESIATGLAEREEFDVLLIGSGPPIEGRPYRYLQAPMLSRERFVGWPKIPPFRSEYRYEECSFVPGLLYRLAKERVDLAVTCSFPFVSLALRRAKPRRTRVGQVFITQNGDWPARRVNAEYRAFKTDGLVCTNPHYFDRHRETWDSTLIPNGVDPERFRPGPPNRVLLGLPENVPLVSMASAFIASKHVELGIRAVARLEGVHLAVAGDGPLREECARLGSELLGDRYHQMSLLSGRMPDYYRAADVFLHLSREEAFGNVYIEALACGKPAVAHDYSTARWILGDFGTFADTSNSDALVGALRTALEAAPSTEASACWRRVDERFSWSVVVSKYAEFFQEVAGRMGQ